MKIKNLLILFISIITFTSCVFTEEIHVKNDGSGSYAMKMDLSKMMEAMGDLGSQNDSIKKKKPEKIDSTIVFKEFLKEFKDSIQNMPEDEQEIIESLKDLKIRIQTDEEKKQMNMDFLFDFKNISDLRNMNDKIQKAQSLSDKKKSNSMGDAFDSTTDVFYSFENKVFRRTVKYKEGVTKEKIEEEKRKLAQGGDEMFDESSYRIIYHFENKIKSVSIKEATISPNGKTLTIEMPMDTILKNPFLLNFEVKLK